MAYKKKFKQRPKKPILLNPNYPIGWGTGLTEKEWGDFARTYTPKTSAENKELMKHE